MHNTRTAVNENQLQIQNLSQQDYFSTVLMY
jgi:hypothetical protein